MRVICFQNASSDIRCIHPAAHFVVQPNCPIGAACGAGSNSTCALPPTKLQCVAGLAKVCIRVGWIPDAGKGMCCTAYQFPPYHHHYHHHTTYALCPDAPLLAMMQDRLRGYV